MERLSYLFDFERDAVSAPELLSKPVTLEMDCVTVGLTFSDAGLKLAFLTRIFVLEAKEFACAVQELENTFQVQRLVV